MNLEQIRLAASKYRQLLPIKVEKTNDQKVFPRPNENLQHCAWMCDQIISGSLDREKAMRWLCFVQGCLWTLGIKTIAEMKDDNRTSNLDMHPGS